ncbi:hypothetical protein D1007_31756 [Hordeum vulgare]|nr:hypothetical protein D1007_31756 [Hordeum vulgare]
MREAGRFLLLLHLDLDLSSNSSCSQCMTPAVRVLVGLNELPPSWDPVVTPNFGTPWPLMIFYHSWPDISKFQTKQFPLYDKLGDLYDGHIAEGNFNFTSIEATQVIDDDPEVERDEIGFSFDLNQCEDDLLMYNDPRDAAQSDGPSGATQSDDPIDGTQSDVTRAGAPGGSNKKLVKEPKKKKRDDPMVEVMANYVEIKRKQAEEESTLFAGSKNAQ